MRGVARHLSYANVVATLALVVAIGGGATAIAISKKVGTKQIRAQAVTANKIADSNVTAAKLAGIDVVQKDGLAFSDAVCPAGERLLSGGARATGGGTLVASYPSGNAWSGIQAGGFGTGISVYALCLRTTP